MDMRERDVILLFERSEVDSDATPALPFACGVQESWPQILWVREQDGRARSDRGGQRLASPKRVNMEEMAQSIADCSSWGIGLWALTGQHSEADSEE